MFSIDDSTCSNKTQKWCSLLSLRTKNIPWFHIEILVSLLTLFLQMSYNIVARVIILKSHLIKSLFYERPIPVLHCPGIKSSVLMTHVAFSGLLYMPAASRVLHPSFFFIVPLETFNSLNVIPWVFVLQFYGSLRIFAHKIEKRTLIYPTSSPVVICHIFQEISLYFPRLG